ncbi:MAG: hypothetical protein PHG65_13255 [Kiritimatiellae bacterium]|nr:hypothetical protein [Kiritimatiellia bacterium]
MLKNGETRQLYKCNTCGRRYSNLNKNGRRTDQMIFDEAVRLRQAGHSYDEILFAIYLKHKKKLSKGTLSKWLNS